VKTCTKCGRTLDLEMFHKNIRSKDGRKSTCKECRKIHEPYIKKKRSPEVAERNRQNSRNYAKKVKASPELLQRRNRLRLEFYYRKKDSRGFLEKRNQESRRRYNDRMKNSTEFKEKMRQKGIDRWKRIKNSPEFKEKFNEKMRERRLIPKYRIDDNFSQAIRCALKGRKGGRKWEDLVGYTLFDLMSHLEALFHPGMTWENYGQYGWHIDHIKPKSLFKYETPEEEEFKKCWSLENLQPLWAEDNIRKGNRYMEDYDG
jgi:hypothetical protein